MAGEAERLSWSGAGQPVGEIAASSCGGTTSSCIGAVARLLVRAPPSKMRQVAEAIALHVLISDSTTSSAQRLPRRSCLLSGSRRPACDAGADCGPPLRGLPRMRSQRVVAIRREVFESSRRCPQSSRRRRRCSAPESSKGRATASRPPILPFFASGQQPRSHNRARA